MKRRGSYDPKNVKTGIPPTEEDVYSSNSRVQPAKRGDPDRRPHILTKSKNYASGGAVRGSGCASRGTKFGGFR